MTNHTAQSLTTEHSRNPMTAFALLAEVGDTFNGEIEVTAVEITGPSANPSAFRRVTFRAYGDTWTTDYPNK
jgi:hypothetical protein